jgi:hypothetical protein
MNDDEYNTKEDDNKDVVLKENQVRVEYDESTKTRRCERKEEALSSTMTSQYDHQLFKKIRGWLNRLGETNLETVYSEI